MHCTVKPGKYCICAPSVAAKLTSIWLRPFDGGKPKSAELPLAAKTTLRKNPRETLRKKKLRAGNVDGGDCAASGLWCQEKSLQDIVVRLQGVATRSIATGA